MTVLFTLTDLHASVMELEIEGGFSRSFSFTDYQIGDTIQYPNGTKATTVFPLSRLKFPLDLVHWYFGAGATILDRVLLNLRVAGNITSDAGIMKDYDWNSWGHIEIYSRSDASLDSCITVDADASYRFLEISFFSLSGGLGLTYQKFGFTCDDLTQWDSSGGTTVVTTYAGNVLEYRVEYYLPYIIIVPRFTIWHFDIAIKLALSPYAVGMDRDDHLLRSKLSTGYATGVAAWGALQIRWNATRSLFLSLEFSAMGVFLDGTQKQERYATTIEGPPGPIAEIDNKIQSRQLNLTFGMGYRIEI